MFINSPWNTNSPRNVGSVAEKIRARKGVAVLKVDAKSMALALSTVQNRCVMSIGTDVVLR
jgi:hypothetical protein